MRIIEANKTGVLNIGFAGEKDRTQVWFDISDVEAEFPGGFVILQAKRAGENTRYDISVETENAVSETCPVMEALFGVSPFVQRAYSQPSLFSSATKLKSAELAVTLLTVRLVGLLQSAGRMVMESMTAAGAYPP